MLKKWDNIYKINILKANDKLKKDKNNKLNNFNKLFSNQNKEQLIYFNKYKYWNKKSINKRIDKNNCSIKKNYDKRED